MKKLFVFVLIIAAAGLIGWKFYPRPPSLPEHAETLINADITDFDGLTLLLYPQDDSGDYLVVTDRLALEAASGKAYVINGGTGGNLAGSLVLGMMGVPLEERYSALFRNEELVSSVQCLSTTCGKFGEIISDWAGLENAARRFEPQSEIFTDYPSYLAQIDAVRADPDLMFLDFAEQDEIPSPVRHTSLSLLLPTIVLPASSAQQLDQILTQERDRLAQTLPEGVTISGLQSKRLPIAVVMEKDTGTLIERNDALVNFPNWNFYNLTLDLDGTSSLDGLDVDAMTSPSADISRLDADFDALMIGELGETCIECFGLKISGHYNTDVLFNAHQTESYTLRYYKAAPGSP